ncbi:MAG: SCO family protein [Asgard group archaeon]|nr:SCO family protein [Asgard group archaeon]
MDKKNLVGLFIGFMITSGVLMAFILAPLAQNQPLSVIKRAPSFTLINQDNQTVTLENFENKIILIGFMYTACQDEFCPLMTTHFKLLQSDLFPKLDTDFQMLSITLDPLYDTPERLKTYGSDYGANFSVWQFLTAHTQAEINKVVDDYNVISYAKDFFEWFNTTINNSTSGFKLSIHHENETYPAELVHSWVSVLIDRTLMIRKIYTSVSWIYSIAKDDILGLI